MFLDFFLPCLGIALGVGAGLAIVSIAVILLLLAAALIYEVITSIRDYMGRDR